MPQDVKIERDGRGNVTATVDGNAVTLGPAMDAAAEITRGRIKHALVTTGRFHLAMPQDEAEQSAPAATETAAKQPSAAKER